MKIFNSAWNSLVTVPRSLWGLCHVSDIVVTLSSYADTLKLTDVGVSPNLPFFHYVVMDGPPPVTYLHLYACSNFSVSYILYTAA